MEVDCNVDIHVLDEPISENEIKAGFKNMKKSGCNYNLPVLSILVTYFTLLLVNLLNMIFYVKYTVSLACSLLALIPKKGNLMLPKTFRGIQMIKILACLYDRIIANRLKLWLPFNADQTAFYKRKSTLIEISN